MHVDSEAQQIRFRHLLGPRVGAQDTLSFRRFSLGDRDFQRLSKKVEEILRVHRTDVDHMQSTRDWLETLPRRLRSYLNERLLAHDEQLVVRAVFKLDEQLDEYEAWRQEQETSIKTDAQVMRDCRKLLSGCPSDVTRITEILLRDLLAALEDEYQYSPNTLARVAKNWHSFFAWLRSRRNPVIDTNPCSYLERTVSSRKKDEVRAEWIDAMVAVGELEDKYWLRLLQLSGCRLGEGLALRVKDFDFSRMGGVILFSESKNNRVRVNPIFAAVAEYLPELLSGREPDELVLRKITINTCYDRLARLQAMAGVTAWDPPFHAFRSTRTNELAKNRKISPQQAGMLLGHSAVVAESNYLSADESTLDLVR